SAPPMERACVVLLGPSYGGPAAPIRVTRPLLWRACVLRGRVALGPAAPTRRVGGAQTARPPRGLELHRTLRPQERAGGAERRACSGRREGPLRAERGSLGLG